MRRNKKIYIWYAGWTRITGKQLKDCLNISGGMKPPKDYVETVINWGCNPTKSNPNFNFDSLDSKTQINKCKIIQMNRDKFEALKALRDGKVRIPNFCLPNEVLNQVNEGKMKFPIIGRTSHHQGGSGFFLAKNMDDLVGLVDNAESDYYLQFIENSKEYRIHVFNGEIIRMARKVKTRDNANEYKRNHSSGWKFVDLRLDRILANGIKTQAIKAVQTIGLDFGAVDIILGNNGKAYVIEINTAPGLTDGGVERYADKIKQFLESKEIRL